MKTNSSFNLSKPVRRIAATILNKDARRIYLNAMIDAEASQVAQKSRKWSDPAAAQRQNRETPKD